MHRHVECTFSLIQRVLNPASDLAQAEVKEMAEIILLGDVPDGQRSAPWKLRPRWILGSHTRKPSLARVWLVA